MVWFSITRQSENKRISQEVSWFFFKLFKASLVLDSPHVFVQGGYGLETLNFWLKIGVYFSENLSAILEIYDFQSFW